MTIKEKLNNKEIKRIEHNTRKAHMNKRSVFIQNIKYKEASEEKMMADVYKGIPLDESKSTTNMLLEESIYEFIK